LQNFVVGWGELAIKEHRKGSAWNYSPSARRTGPKDGLRRKSIARNFCKKEKTENKKEVRRRRGRGRSTEDRAIERQKGSNEPKNRKKLKRGKNLWKKGERRVEGGETGLRKGEMGKVNSASQGCDWELRREKGDWVNFRIPPQNKREKKNCSQPEDGIQ